MEPRACGADIEHYLKELTKDILPERLLPLPPITALFFHNFFSTTASRDHLVFWDFHPAPPAGYGRRRNHWKSSGRHRSYATRRGIGSNLESHCDQDCSDARPSSSSCPEKCSGGKSWRRFRRTGRSMCACHYK